VQAWCLSFIISAKDFFQTKKKRQNGFREQQIKDKLMRCASSRESLSLQSNWILNPSLLWIRV
jgi:hypothetical protein